MNEELLNEIKAKGYDDVDSFILSNYKLLTDNQKELCKIMGIGDEKCLSSEKKIKG